MSKAGNGTLGYTIEVETAMGAPKGLDWSSVLWVDHHGPDDVKRIWERGEKGTA